MYYATICGTRLCVTEFQCDWSSAVFSHSRRCPSPRLAGTPPLAQAWLVQSVVYVGIMIVEKLLVSALIQLDIWDTISRIILAPVTNPRLELALVVLVVPFFVNVSGPGGPGLCIRRSGMGARRLVNAVLGFSRRQNGINSSRMLVIRYLSRR